jgi:hypothetical protein
MMKRGKECGIYEQRKHGQKQGCAPPLPRANRLLIPLFAGTPHVSSLRHLRSGEKESHAGQTDAPREREGARLDLSGKPAGDGAVRF